MSDSGQRLHFAVLDGLRGLAAIVVLFYHVSKIEGGAMRFFSHGHLAVDFFFMLSGFVLAYSYDDRLKSRRLAARTFVRARAVRLLPMVIFGLPLGAAYCVLEGSISADNLVLFGVFIAAGAISLAIPFENPFQDNVTPLNGPCWSLFFELYVGTAMILLLRRIGNRWLILLLAISWCLLAVVTLEIAYNSGGGPKTFIGGFPRFVFTFGLGILLWRLRLHQRALQSPPFIAAAALLRARGLTPLIRMSAPFVAATALLALLVMPNPIRYYHFYELAVVTLVFPPILLLGAASQPSERLRPWCDGFGRLSYPLYATHYLVLLLCGYFIDGTWGIFVGGAVAIIVAWGSLVFYDEPLRARLSSSVRPPRLVAAELPSS